MKSDALVLVSGANGFTGRYLIPELKKTYGRVFSLRSRLEDLDALKSELRNSQPSHIINLAGRSSPGHPRPADFYRDNVTGVENLLKVAWEVCPSIRSVVLLSSVNLLVPVRGIVREASETKAVSDYSMSKLLMERLASEWRDRLPINIIRPCNYTGPGQGKEFVIPKIVSSFKSKDKKLSLGNLSVRREFNDVRDVVGIIVRILGLRENGLTLNLCSGKDSSLLEVIECLSCIANHRLDVETDLKFVRAGDSQVLKGDPSILEKTLGASELFRIPLNDTLSSMYFSQD